MSPLATVIERELHHAERRAPRVSMPVGEPVTWSSYVTFCWNARRCFVCSKLGPCRHREGKAESVHGYRKARMR